MNNRLPKTHAPQPKSGASKFLLIAWYAVAIVIISAAVLVSIARLFTPTVARYKDQILQQASEQVGYPIQIQALDASWLGLRPVLKLSGVDILNPQTDESVLHIDRIYIAVDIAELIFSQKIATAQLVLTGSRARIWHNTQNQYWLGGPSGILLNPAKKVTKFNLLEFLFAQPQVSIKNINIEIQHNKQSKQEIYVDEFSLLNHHNHHRILTKLRPREQHNAELKILIKLVGKMTQPQHWRAQMFMLGHKITFSEWHIILDFFPQYHLGGHANFSIWLDWKDFLHKFQMNIDWDHPRLQIADVKHSTKLTQLNINNIAGAFTWINDQKKGWLLAGNKIHVSVPKKEFSESTFYMQKKIKTVLASFGETKSIAEGEDYTETASDWNIYFGHLDLDLLSMLSTLDLPFTAPANPVTGSSQETLKQKSYNHLLTALNPKGLINHLQLQLQHDGKKITHYKIKTQFENLSIKPYQKWPSIRGLNGFIQATPSSGHAQFYASNVAIYFPNLFPHSHTFDSFNATLGFDKVNHDLLVHVPRLYLKNSDLEAKLKLALKTPNIFMQPENNTAPSAQDEPALHTPQPRILQLIGSVKSSTPKHVWHYFPVGILSKDLSTWLTQAIQIGPHTTGHARIIFQGALSDFPFVQHNGRFVVESDVTKVNLTYHPRWPKITDIDGNLRFDANQMFIHASHGKIFNSTIKEATAYIDDLLAKPIHLYVNGRMQGSSNDGLNFLQTSPLRNKIGATVDRLTLVGNLDLDLNLDIPIASENSIRYTGNARLTENQLKIPNWNIVMDKINTLINFSQDKIQTSIPSHARLWQRPVQFSINTEQKNKNSNLLVDLNGALDIAQLKKQFNFELLNQVSGHLNYHAALSIPSNPQNAQDQILTISSNLLGTKVDLPKPLAKTAKNIEPFLLQIYFGLLNKNQIKMSYGKKIAAALTFQKDRNSYKLYSGEIAIGPNQANFQTSPGILVQGSLAGFDIPFWRNYLNPEKKGTSLLLKKKTSSNLSGNLSNLVTRLNLQIPEFNLVNAKISNLHITGNKNARGWTLMLNNPSFSGTLTIPHNYPLAPVYANFRRLNLSAQSSTSLINKSNSQINFKDIPPIILLSQDTTYGSRNFGRVEMELRPTHDGLNIHRLSSRTPHYSLIAEGNWFNHQGRPISTFNGEIKSNQLRRALQDWQLPKNIESNHALFQFNVSWSGSPVSPDLPSLKGNLNIKLDKGHISGINDGAKIGMGLGQIINLLSLETLTRSLKSISSAPKSGYSFDRMSGKFNFSQGNALTKDTKFEGPIADVMLSGRIGYVHKDYDLNLAIAPELTSSLPLVATLAGGPVAGFAALAAKQILSPTLKKVTTYHYKVNGSWDKPHIKEQKSDKRR